MEWELIVGFVAYVGALYGAKLKEEKHLGLVSKEDKRRLGKVLNFYRILALLPLVTLMFLALFFSSGIERRFLVGGYLAAAAVYGLVLWVVLGRTLGKNDVDPALTSRLGAAFLLRYAGEFALMAALGFWLLTHLKTP